MTDSRKKTGMQRKLNCATLWIQVVMKSYHETKIPVNHRSILKGAHALPLFACALCLDFVITVCHPPYSYFAETSSLFRSSIYFLRRIAVAMTCGSMQSKNHFKMTLTHSGAAYFHFAHTRFYLSFLLHLALLSLKPHGSEILGELTGDHTCDSC